MPSERDAPASPAGACDAEGAAPGFAPVDLFPAGSGLWRAEEDPCLLERQLQRELVAAEPLADEEALLSEVLLSLGQSRGAASTRRSAAQQPAGACDQAAPAAVTAAAAAADSLTARPAAQQAPLPGPAAAAQPGLEAWGSAQPAGLELPPDAALADVERRMAEGNGPHLPAQLW